jgi:PAS domain S-box-containing protein
VNELLNNVLAMNPTGIEGGYRALVEAMCEGVAALAADGTVLYCNERLSDLLGVPLHRIIGSPVTRHLSKRTTHAVETLLGRARSGEPITARLNLRIVNGRCVPVQLSIREMNSIENATCCVVITDLTERKAQDELVAAGRLSRLILESVTDAIAVCDGNGNVISGNKAFEDLCGCNPIFQPFDVVLPLELTDEIDLAGTKFHIAEPLSGVAFRGRKMRYRSSNGQSVPLLTSAAPIRTSRLITGCVLTLTDISEREQVMEARLQKEKEFARNEQLRALAGRLENAREEERKRVARDLHDQIGQILSAIKMDLAWVTRHMPESHGDVQNRLNRTIEMINLGVRSVHGICTGLRPGVLDDLGLAAAIEWQANEFASRTGISFQVSVPPDEVRLDSGCEAAIFRILQECLTNIVRHAGAKTVRISLRLEDEDLFLVVVDDGTGFFETEVTGSLGFLGMNERAQMCGGEVQVSSCPDRGTTVTVRIPVRDASSRL